MKIIAHIRTDYKEKFGIPRQSGLTDNRATIVFEPEYRRPEAFRGITGFSHLWLIWSFSAAVRPGWSPTVRPPRLGGNRRMGVFATRSPYRPNPIGLSSVRLLAYEQTDEGPVLTVSGADLLDGTPIYDIKPYLAYTDSHPDAVGGFADGVRGHRLAVVCPPTLLERLSADRRDTLLSLLADDPRPSYQHDATREYAFRYGEWEIRFRVEGEVLTVLDIATAPLAESGPQ